MSAQSQAYRDAKSFLVTRDFEAAIELLSSLETPSPEEMCLLADAYMLSAYWEREGEDAEGAFGQALQLYSLHHDAHPQPTMVYRLWAAAAYYTENEEELIQAKEAGLKKSNDPWLLLTHYKLKQYHDAPLDEKEELIDQALSLSPDHEIAGILKAELLARRREWKKSWELMCQVLQVPSTELMEQEVFPMHLIHAALLSLIQGQEWEPWFTWAQDVGPQHVWVRAAERLLASDTKKQQVERAKELLSGEADFEGQSFDEWIGAVPTVQPVVMEEKELSKEEPEKERKTYSHDHIERMGPEMREKVIIQILVKGIRRMEQRKAGEDNGQGQQ